MIVWCVRTDADGRFRSASSGNTTITSFDEWASIDPNAAEQFAGSEYQDRDVRVQAAFMRATGLDRSATLVTSMSDAYNGHISLGGTHVTTSSAARSRTSSTARSG